MSNTEPRVEVRPDRRSVLPWRRHHVDLEVAPLIAVYRERHRKADTALIEQAFEVARVAHADQVRRSGEPYIAHPLGVAMILADLGLRSEEHTSELQSLAYIVCRPLLDKKTKSTNESRVNKKKKRRKEEINEN